jgi:hypothetical protein
MVYQFPSNHHHTPLIHPDSTRSPSHLYQLIMALLQGFHLRLTLISSAEALFLRLVSW